MKCLDGRRLDLYGLVVEKNRDCIHRAVGKLEGCLGFVHGSLPLREYIYLEAFGLDYI
jgi:hypothetical protein